MTTGSHERVSTSETKPYRKNWEWDSVHWGTHCVDCYPGDCPVRVYVKDGKVVREEQSGTLVKGFQTSTPWVARRAHRGASRFTAPTV